MEPYYTAAGKRIFSVSANGATLISNLDISTKVGQNTALEEPFPITITSGTLNLTFTPTVDNAIISAFALVQS